MPAKKNEPVTAQFVDAQGPGPGPKTAIAVVERGPWEQLTMYRKPEDVLEEAGNAAKALMQVIQGRPKDEQLIMNGKQYLVCEDWQLVGNFYGTVPKIRQVDFVQYDLGRGRIVSGFNAVCELIHIKSGNVISSAEAMCMNDEPKWATKNKYAWCYVGRDGAYHEQDPGPDMIVWEPNPNKPGKHRPKKERVHMGEEAVPIFQLKSMAQTRAEAKVLRVVFSHIVVLAGYGSTPAEELDDVGHGRAAQLPARPDEDGPPDSAYEGGPAAYDTEPPQQPAAQPAGKKKAAKKVKAEPAKPAPPPPPPPAAAPAPPPPQNGKGPMKITSPQRIRLYAISTENGWSEKQVKAALKKELNLDHSTDILQGRLGYDRFVELLQQGPKKAGYAQ